MKKVFTVILICVCSVLLIGAFAVGVFVYQNSHTVNFYTNGAPKLKSKNCLVLLDTPEITREGYSFAGWYLDDKFTQEADAPMFLNEDTTLYAAWNKNKYLVEFVTNGGTGVASINVGSIDEAPRTVRNGYLLEGWYYEPEFVTRAVFPMEVNKEITLYAKWKKSYKVTFVRNGGTGVSEMAACEINESPYTFKQEYRFKGWYFDSKFEEKAEFPMVLSEDITLYAWWEEIVYLVNFETNGGSPIATREVGQIETAPVTYRDGYTLLGWYKDAAMTTKAAFPLRIKENMTLYAKWEKTAYTAVFVTNGGTPVATGNFEMIATAPITYREGYTFLGWYKNSALTTKVSFPFKLTSDIVLYAKWEKTSYAVNFVTNGGRSIGSYYTDRIENAPTPVRDHYLFDGWYLDENLIQVATFPMNIDSNITLYAKWLLSEKSDIYDDFKIKNMDSSYYSGMSLNMTLSGFDLPALAAKGYTITITVSYNVHYVKDYVGVGDIGYLGSPKYEVDFLVAGNTVKSQYDLGTSQSLDKRTVSYTALASYFYGKNIKVKFSTDNIQNQVHIEDIVITYKCTK